MTSHHKPKRINTLAPYRNNKNGFCHDNAEIVFGDPLTASERRQKSRERIRVRFSERYKKRL